MILDPNAVPPGSTVTLLGFGLTSASNQNSAGLLNVLSSKVTGDCTKLAAGANLTPPANNTNLICIDQTNGTGVCSGDSGSPAFFMTSGGLAVAGMTSFGDSTCDIVGAYTRLSAETAFFEAQMMAAGACDADGISHRRPAVRETSPPIRTARPSRLTPAPARRATRAAPARPPRRAVARLPAPATVSPPAPPSSSRSARS